MWKKIIACMLIMLSLISISTLSYATTVDASKYEILNPEKSSYSTEENIVLVNGKAPSGTEITVNVYGTTDNNGVRNARETSFNLDNLPTEKDYILKATEKVTSGNMGLFQKQMDLVKGINKVVIDFGVEGIDPVEIIVYVYNRSKIVTRDAIKTTTILPLLK
jgi:hypothetical protein